MSKVESTNWLYNTLNKTIQKRQFQLKELKEGDIRIKVSAFAVIPTDIFAKADSEEGTAFESI